MHRLRRLVGACALVALLAAAITVLVPAETASAVMAGVTCERVTGTPVEHAPRESYTPITPQRLVDTRDGTGGLAQPIPEACTLIIDLTDSPLPDDVQAVALSVTAISPQRGFLTVFGCAEGQPDTSNLNTRAGFPTPNLVVTAVDANRRICIYSRFESHVIVDLAGWFADGPDRYAPVAPARAYDTRELPGGAPLPAGEMRPIPLAGTLLPADATAAMVNLTVIGGSGPGFLVAFPCGTAPPLASNLNFLPGEARAVAAIVGLGLDGEMCVMSNVDVHVIVDVTGAYRPAPAFGPSPALHSLVGHRVVDTRTPEGPWNTPFAPFEERRVDPLAGTAFAGRGGAVVLNVVATNIAGPGFVSFYPCGGSVPLVSSLNLAFGGEATNLVPVELGATGEICVLSSQTTDLVIDLFGVLGPPGDDPLAERLDVAGRNLFPTYASDGGNYAVRCGTGTTSVAFEIDPLPGVALLVNNTVRTPGAIRIDVPKEGLTTIELRRGVDRRVHYFRCVPPDFPVLNIDRPGDTKPGWYLTTLAGGTNFSGRFLVILDERGAPVWFKRTDVGTLDFKRLANGQLAYTTQLGTTYGVDTEHGYRITDLEGRLLAERLTVDPVAFPVDHHDFVDVPGGGWAMLSYPLVDDPQDLSVLDGTLGMDFFEDEWIVDGVIQEMNAAGQVVWSWSAREHFSYEEVTFPQRFTQYPGAPHGGEVDVWHLNSLDRVADGDYVVSARHLDAVFRVDSMTGDVEWILGGSASVDRPERLDIIGDPLGRPRRPHDARLVGDVLTLFDNRAGTNGPARAVAYRIDTAAGTATMLWEIREPQRRASPGLGAARITPDGSVLIGWGALQPMFQEYTTDGELLMTISDIPAQTPYRIVKYAPSAFDAAELRATAGGTAEAPG